MSDFIYVADDVLSKDVCDGLIARFEKSPHRQPGMTGAGLDPDKKHSTDLSITGAPGWNDAVNHVVELTSQHLEAYAKRHFFMVIGAISPTVADPESGEPVELNPSNFTRLGSHYLPGLMQYIYRYGDIHAQKYDKGVGGYPHWHSEVYPDASGTDPLHRVLFWMYYLNDVQEGGETEFFYQQRKVTPKAGRLVIAPAGFTHTHRGNVPVSGDKYILTSWLLYRSAQELYQQPA